MQLSRDESERFGLYEDYFMMGGSLIEQGWITAMQNHDQVGTCRACKGGPLYAVWIPKMGKVDWLGAVCEGLVQRGDRMVVCGYEVALPDRYGAIPFQQSTARQEQPVGAYDTRLAMLTLVADQERRAEGGR